MAESAAAATGGAGEEEREPDELAGGEQPPDVGGDERPDTLAPAELAERLGSDLERGLDETEAAERLGRDGPNELPPPRRRAFAGRLLDQLREPMSLLLIAAAAVSGVALGERVDAVAIGAIVVLNAVIALVQEGRAARALEALERLQAPAARVRRSGGVTELLARELVVGDVVLLEAGDRVPADVRLVEGTAVQADESMLTGESVPVDKHHEASDAAAEGLFDRPGLLFTGTLLTRGAGVGLVVATGPRTALGGIAGQLEAPAPATPLQRELAGLSARLGTVAVAVAAGVFLLTLARTGLSVEWLERSFLSAVALAVAAVPEGLATVTLVALAVGVRRMAAQRAIVRRLPAVETLGAATVILTDKTGTLTLNRMRVEAAAAADGGWLPANDPASPISTGEPHARDSPVDHLPEAVGAAAHEVGVLCSDAQLDPPVGDPVEVALLEAAGAPLVARLRAEAPRLAVAPFDALRRRMSTVHRLGDGTVRLLVKGAPEVVLERCTAVLDAAGRACPLDAVQRDRFRARVDAAAADGLRVLALARRDLDRLPAGEAPTPSDAGTDVEAAEANLLLVALVGLRDPVRPEAAAAVAEANAAGIRIVMATGDHAGTAAAIARRVGLDNGRAVTGAELRAAGLPEDPAATAVYARVDPGQKLALVEALQARGDVVAMTGDGVNDAPALRRADIGVALGARGSDVAREAGDLVITDDNLATIVTAVREGRGIYDNIRKVVDYLVAGNFSEIAVVVGALLLLPALGVPLLPLQLLWVNLLTDGLPALALGNDRTDPTLMRHPPRSRHAHLLDRRRIGQLLGRGAAVAVACLAVTAVALLSLGHDPERARTLLLTTLVVAHLLYAFVARQPATAHLRDPLAPAGLIGTPWLLAAVVLGLALHTLIVVWPPAQTVFGTTALTLGDWGLVAGGAVVALAGTVLVRRLGPQPHTATDADAARA